MVQGIYGIVQSRSDTRVLQDCVDVVFNRTSIVTIAFDLGPQTLLQFPVCWRSQERSLQEPAPLRSRSR